MVAKRSPVHQRLCQSPTARRFSEQAEASALSAGAGRRSSESNISPRSSFRGGHHGASGASGGGAAAQTTTPPTPVSPPPPAVVSKPVARSNSTGTDARATAAGVGATAPGAVDESHRNVKPSMFKHGATVAPPPTAPKHHRMHSSPVVTSSGSSPSTSDSESSTFSYRQVSPNQPAKPADGIETEGLLRPSKIKSIVSGHGSPKPKPVRQQAVTSAPSVPSVPTVPAPPPAPPTFSPKQQKAIPINIPQVPKLPTVAIRTGGNTPPQHDLALSPPRKNSADLIGEISTFKLKKKEKVAPAGKRANGSQ